ERVDYRLATTVEYRPDGLMNLHFRLVDTITGTVIWTRTFERLPVGANESATEEKGVSEPATTLMQPFGVLRSRERSKLLKAGVGDPRGRCLVQTSEAFRSFDPADHTRARTCLEEIVSLDPSFALGFAYLGALYFREYQFGFDERPGQPPA